MPPDVEDSGPQPLLFVALMVALSTAASTFSGSTPMLAAFLGQEWHYSPADVGWTVTVFTLGTTLGAVAVAGAIRGWRVRRILWLGMVLTVLSNGLLALHPALPAALALNLISGLGSGAVNSVAVGYLVYGPTPHRDLAALTVTQSLFAAFLLQAVIPHFVDVAQASSLFMLMALVMLVAVPAARRFRATEVIPSAYLNGPVRPLGVVLILLCMFLSFASAGVMWTFLAAHAQAGGLSEAYVSDVLTATNLLSLVMCLGVTWMARHGLYRWCLAMLAVAVLAGAALTLLVSPARFAVAACAFVASWTVASVIVPTLLPAYDPVGRRAALTPAAFGLGYAAGSLGGGLIGEQLGLHTAFVLAGLLAALALVALLSLRVWAWQPTMQASASHAPMLFP
jgi:predicted MFS family arabinose efflux permease